MDIWYLVILAFMTGVLIDLDHIYFFFKYHKSDITSFKNLKKLVLNAYNKPSDISLRYHTWSHELLGLIVNIIIMLPIGLIYDMNFFYFSFFPHLIHVVLDGLSVKMMLLAPFYRYEIHLNILNNQSWLQTIILCIIAVSLSIVILVL